jgi:hypothetical protein
LTSGSLLVVSGAVEDEVALPGQIVLALLELSQRQRPGKPQLVALLLVLVSAYEQRRRLAPPLQLLELLG